MLCCWLFLFLFSITKAQNRFDVVIDEMMTDPSPSVGLPNYEWLELKNTSGTAINLLNWRIGDASGLSGPLPAYFLQPDSFVVVCSSTALPLLAAFGPSISTSNFPSFDNDGDQVYLRSANGKTIHSLRYDPGWYHNEAKKEGGWTLEMIDTRNPCGGSSNWKASTAVIGGSPAKKNTADAINNDNRPPELLRSYSLDELNIILCFNEPLDSSSASSPGNYSADGGLIIREVSVVPPLFTEVKLKLLQEMHYNTVYNITASNVKDCKGNRLITATKTKAGLPVDPQPGEWIINELLFDPRPGAYDYVEFYNNSNKIFDAWKLYVANRSSGGVVGSTRALSNAPFYIFPGDYIVVTEDTALIQRQYRLSDPSKLIQISTMPSFPDDDGFVVASGIQGIIVDELHYNKDWQFKLLRDPEGVSLERIDPNGITQDPANWHSASSTSGYGTPGMQNSQYKRLSDPVLSIEVSPKIISPDSDGYDDFATILYQMEAPGYVANINIYDLQGRCLRYLVKNALLGIKGSWQWDGLDDKGNKVPIGNYIMVTELFNLSGKRKTLKNLVVVAARMN